MSHTVRAAACGWIVAALFASAPGLLAASAADRKEAQAQILERENFPCVNCFFGAAHYYFCFAADSKIVIADDRIFTFNWTDGNKNYFGKVYKAWKIPMTTGQTVTIQYDDKHVWMPRGDGKQIRMKRDDSSDIFTNPQCRSAAAKADSK